jgi:hypothetical protein
MGEFSYVIWVRPNVDDYKSKLKQIIDGEGFRPSEVLKIRYMGDGVNNIILNAVKILFDDTILVVMTCSHPAADYIHEFTEKLEEIGEIINVNLVKTSLEFPEDMLP